MLTGSLTFTAANNFVGLRNGVAAGEFDLFLWEKFTTKPWVDRGELAVIAEVPTPWTAFSIVGRNTHITRT